MYPLLPQWLHWAIWALFCITPNCGAPEPSSSFAEGDNRNRVFINVIDSSNIIVRVSGVEAVRCVDRDNPNDLLAPCSLCVSLHESRGVACVHSLHLSLATERSATSHIRVFLLNQNLTSGEIDTNYCQDHHIAQGSVLLDSLVDPMLPVEPALAKAISFDGSLRNLLYTSPKYMKAESVFSLAGEGGEEEFSVSAIDLNTERVCAPGRSCSEEAPHQIKIGILIAQLSNHGANNRLISWASFLSAQSMVDLHLFSGCEKILTEGKSNLVYQQLSSAHRIVLHYEPLLHEGENEVVDMINSERLNASATSALMQLRQYIRGMDAVIVTNGEAYPMDLFLSLATEKTLGSKRPLILMDLSNIAHAGISNAVDLFVAPSQHAALVSSIYISKPIAVIYPDLNSYFTQSDPCVRILERDGKQEFENKTFTFLYVGRLSPEKSPGIFLRALAALRAQFLTSEDLNGVAELSTPFRGVVVGDGPLLQPLKRLAFELGITDIIDFKGNVPLNVIWSYMDAAGVLVNPRGSGETFGYTHIEAAAMGLPVVAFDRGANRESCVFGILVAKLSIQALSEALLTVYLERKEIFSRANVCRTVSSQVRSRDPSKQAWALKQLILFGLQIKNDDDEN